MTRFNLHYDSPDFDAALIFYRDTLGWAIKRQFDEHGRRGVIFAVNEVVELAFFGQSENEPQRVPAPGTIRLKVYVDDVDAEYDRLTAAGVAVIDPITDREWGERSFGIRAVDGLVIHFCKER